ncbi:MAG: 50S ribosomal protein L11 [Candidatus Nanoarchaeia archaeon]|nr:50S ribosomal protein L11 [Candidatus Nanoarchaeia archaeon]MDD5357558.1 50S ribosomal protein L11 [Candidatus Nanoarchaeia archaeon]MDD5588477.1 50S ribosomal protein L11 [Candidatus Nanoarchaeia archaeon]
MIIKLLVDGGAMKPGPALSQKLGPLGIPVNNVIQKVNEATKSFDGIQVPVELNVEPSTREFDIKVFSPPVSGLLKKELKIEKGSGAQKKVLVGNASIEQIISVAKTKFPNMLCKDLKSAVKTIAGTCVSLGILIENKPAAEVEQEIIEGKYDREINSEKTETSPDKKKQLDEYFAKIKKEQDRILQQEKAAKESEEAAKKETAAVPAAAPPAPAKK